ncbi:hypothetical protein O6H91_08G038500 [Diphasiastrum complanatum]|uniref:Uncharacterized protein n=1 Tax=Diphasiastrum complanatum TaxID=34168 RepID=A0ACC2CWW8_DIPCM|nr:hypothetical protein O6H91_08G038500 [Diphasiastrum complanatum]
MVDHTSQTSYFYRFYEELLGLKGTWSDDVGFASIWAWYKLRKFLRVVNHMIVIYLEKASFMIWYSLGLVSHKPSFTDMGNVRTCESLLELALLLNKISINEEKLLDLTHILLILEEPWQHRIDINFVAKFLELNKHMEWCEP